MSCILKITDPILKPLLEGAGLKSSYSNIDELREAFEGVADKAFVIPLSIKAGDYSRRKFGKVYKDDGIKLQIVMPGQEFFSQFTVGEIPLEEFGQTDQKGITLTFESIDTFLGFYLANYLYVTPENLLTQGNRKGLVDSIGDILTNTLGRIKGFKGNHSRAIEDLKFADLKRCLEEELQKSELEWALKPISIFQKEGEKTKNMTFNINLTNHERTLTTNEVNKLIEQISWQAHEQLQAEQI